MHKIIELIFTRLILSVLIAAFLVTSAKAQDFHNLTQELANRRVHQLGYSSYTGYTKDNWEKVTAFAKQTLGQDIMNPYTSAQDFTETAVFGGAGVASPPILAGRPIGGIDVDCVTNNGSCWTSAETFSGVSKDTNGFLWLMVPNSVGIGIKLDTSTYSIGDLYVPSYTATNSSGQSGLCGQLAGTPSYATCELYGSVLGTLSHPSSDLLSLTTSPPPNSNMGNIAWGQWSAGFGGVDPFCPGTNQAPNGLSPQGCYDLAYSNISIYPWPQNHDIPNGTLIYVSTQHGPVVTKLVGYGNTATMLANSGVPSWLGGLDFHQAYVSWQAYPGSGKTDRFWFVQPVVGNWLPGDVGSRAYVPDLYGCMIPLGTVLAHTQYDSFQFQGTYAGIQAERPNMNYPFSSKNGGLSTQPVGSCVGIPPY